MCTSGRLRCFDQLVFILSYLRLEGDLVLMYIILRNGFGPDISLFLPTRSGELTRPIRLVKKTDGIQVLTPSYRFLYRTSEMSMVPGQITLRKSTVRRSSLWSSTTD